MPQELIIITGASSGIGAATARAFAQAGYPLLLMARRLERLHALELSQAICAQVDVTNRAQLADAIATAEAKFGPAACLVNNAGVMLLGQVAQQDPNEWATMFNVNVLGLLNGIHAVLPGMIQRRRGTIINIGSVAGRKTVANHAVYCGTKFAVHAITENIREEVAPHNVRLITIAPGVVETELLSHTTSPRIVAEYEQFKRTIGGGISSEEVAQVVLSTYQQPAHLCVREVVLAPTHQTV